MKSALTVLAMATAMVAVVDPGEEDLVGGRMNRGRERGEWEEGSRR